MQEDVPCAIQEPAKSKPPPKADLFGSDDDDVLDLLSDGPKTAKPQPRPQTSPAKPSPANEDDKVRTMVCSTA